MHIPAPESKPQTQMLSWSASISASTSISLAEPLLEKSACSDLIKLHKLCLRNLHAAPAAAAGSAADCSAAKYHPSLLALTGLQGPLLQCRCAELDHASD